MKKYFLYGMVIESDMDICELLPADEDSLADMRIQIVDNIECTADIDYPCKFVVTQDNCIMAIDDIANYQFDKGNIINVAPKKDISSHDVVSFLLGSAFGYRFILNNIVALHGGAVSNDDKGIIITGESGAGKSTVNTALFAKGYSFIADDVCALSIDDNSVRINLAYPQLKLCRDAALDMGYDLSQLRYIDEDRDKFAVKLKKDFRKEGAEFKYLFELRIYDGESIKIEEINGYEKVQTILANIYRGETGFKMWQIAPEYMKKLLFIASKIQIFRIWRPKNKNTLEEILDFIENKLK